MICNLNILFNSIYVILFFDDSELLHVNFVCGIYEHNALRYFLNLFKPQCHCYLKEDSLHNRNYCLKFCYRLMRLNRVHEIKPIKCLSLTNYSVKVNSNYIIFSFFPLYVSPFA